MKNAAKLVGVHPVKQNVKAVQRNCAGNLTNLVVSPVEEGGLTWVFSGLTVWNHGNLSLAALPAGIVRQKTVEDSGASDRLVPGISRARKAQKYNSSDVVSKLLGLASTQFLAVLAV